MHGCSTVCIYARSQLLKPAMDAMHSTVLATHVQSFAKPLTRSSIPMADHHGYFRWQCNGTSLCVDQYKFYRSHMCDAVLLTCGSGTVLAQQHPSRQSLPIRQVGQPSRIALPSYLSKPAVISVTAPQNCCFRAQNGPMKVYGAASHTIKTAMAPRGRFSAETCNLSRGVC